MKTPSTRISIINLESKRRNSQKPADFEKAVTATGFGKFNLLLILIAIPASWASAFESTTMSYVFTVSQCDLNLSLDDKGNLNAITYSGMVTSALIWGFLFDTLGRKKLIALGFLLDAFFVFLSGFSQDITLLMVSKFLGGFIINGPYAAFNTYISEFHATKYRPKILMILGFINSVGSIVMPLLAWWILPKNLDVSYLDGKLKFHSWNFYLWICALPSFISGVIMLFLPESPKFLMTTGYNDKALDIFRRVYSINSGNAPESFPVDELVDEIEMNNSTNKNQITANRTKVQALKEGWHQLTPLFQKPYLVKLILVCGIQGLIVMAINTLRLWMPQIFKTINDYEHFHNGTSADLCTMLEFIQPNDDLLSVGNNSNNQCLDKETEDMASVYINSMIIPAVSCCSYFIAGGFINKIGKKTILSSLGIISGLFGISIYFSQDSLTTLVTSSIFISLGSIICNVVLAVIVEVFPTTLRTMTIALAMMVARIGSMTGNLLFPILIRAGCEPPFFLIGGIMISSGLLSLVLPNTEMKALQ